MIYFNSLPYHTNVYSNFLKLTLKMSLLKQTLGNLLKFFFDILIIFDAPGTPKFF